MNREAICKAEGIEKEKDSSKARRRPNKPRPELEEAKKIWPELRKRHTQDLSALMELSDILSNGNEKPVPLSTVKSWKFKKWI